MPKDTDQNTQDTSQEQPILTLREGIRAAIDEVKEKDSQEQSAKSVDSKVSVDTKEPVVAEAPDKEPTKITAKADPKEPEQLELDLGDKKQSDKKPEDVTDKQPKVEAKAPFGTPKELRAKWSDFDDDTRGYLTKVVKENLDLKSDAGRKSYLREVDTVLQPYMPELQRLKASPAVLVKRLLEYSDALGSPQHKYYAIAKLAEDFQIDLSLFSATDQQTGRQSQQQQTAQNQPEYYIPPEVDQKLDTILDKFGQFEDTQRSASDIAAKSYVDSWAGLDANTGEYTKRPYFPYVRQAMYQLIASGTVPVENGTVNLDKAYETACFLSDEVRERVTEDYNREQVALVEQKRQQQVKQAQKARFAGSSIRSGAPIPNTSNPDTKSNSGKSSVSIRDSIKAALQEHRA